MSENHNQVADADAHRRYEVSIQGASACSWHGGHKQANQYAKSLAEINGVPYVVTDAKTKASQIFSPSDKAAAKRKERDNSPIRRLQDAIEGECDGLGISDEQAQAILDYVRNEHADSRKALIAALADAQAALAMMIAPDAIKNTTVTGAFAAATAAEAKARAALSQARA